jgi:hypothetical protein
LDLCFVESMLKAVGPVDLLNDYKKYDQYIMGDADDQLEALEDFEAFARTVGALVNKAPSTDVIQLALREPQESAVYKQAKEMATLRPERLYLEWTNRRKVRGEHSATILHHGNVESARFLVDMTKILTSNGDGQIKVWDVHSGEVLHRFPGHKMRVSSLELCPDGDFFASGSEDGSVKIWDLGTFMSNDAFLLEEQREVLRKFLHLMLLPPQNTIFYTLMVSQCYRQSERSWPQRLELGQLSGQHTRRSVPPDRGQPDDGRPRGQGPQQPELPL